MPWLDGGPIFKSLSTFSDFFLCFVPFRDGDDRSQWLLEGVGPERNEFLIEEGTWTGPRGIVCILRKCCGLERHRLRSEGQVFGNPSFELCPPPSVLSSPRLSQLRRWSLSSHLLACLHLKFSSLQSVPPQPSPLPDRLARGGAHSGLSHTRPAPAGVDCGLQLASSSQEGMLSDKL